MNEMDRVSVHGAHGLAGETDGLQSYAFLYLYSIKENMGCSIIVWYYFIVNYMSEFL